MPHHGRKSRAGRRQESTSSITPHPFIKYGAKSAQLIVDIDFIGTGLSPFQQQERARSFLEVLPQYEEFTNIVFISATFQKPQLDQPLARQGPSRLEVLAQTVEKLNVFPHIKEIRFLLSIDEFDWEQIRPVSAIYGLKFPEWTFDVVEKGKKVQHIKTYSRLDRRLLGRYRQTRYQSPQGEYGG